MITKRLLLKCYVMIRIISGLEISWLNYVGGEERHKPILLKTFPKYMSMY